MKIVITCLLLIVFCTTNVLLFGKEYKGHLLDIKSNEPLVYVNVGLVGGNVGTVTDEQGIFTITIPSKLATETIRFSLIGYKPLEMKAADFFTECQETDCIFYLEKIHYELNTLTYKAKDVIKKKLGNRLTSSNTKIGFHDNRKGYEMGIPLKMKARPAYLERLTFYIYDCTYDTIFYRLNIYAMENGLPTKNILREPIYLEYPKAAIKKKLTVHLLEYNIYVEGDILVSLELVTNLKGQGLFLSTSLGQGTTFFRTTSQASWKQIPVGIGMSAVVMQEK